MVTVVLTARVGMVTTLPSAVAPAGSSSKVTVWPLESLSSTLTLVSVTLPLLVTVIS